MRAVISATSACATGCRTRPPSPPTQARALRRAGGRRRRRAGARVVRAARPGAGDGRRRGARRGRHRRCRTHRVRWGLVLNRARRRAGAGRRARPPPVRAVGVRGPQPGERRADGGGVARRAGARSPRLARRGGAVTEVTLATAFGCPYAGPVPGRDVQRGGRGGARPPASSASPSPTRSAPATPTEVGGAGGRGGRRSPAPPGRRPPPRHPRAWPWPTP